MAYGIQVFSEVNGNKLFDSTEPYKGMCVVDSGLVSLTNFYYPADSQPGVVYGENDIVLFKPQGDIASGNRFVISGLTREYTSTTYKVFFKGMTTGSGTSLPSKIEYVVLRPMDDIYSTGYGLATYDYVGGYTIKTFDSRAFTTPDEVQITNNYTYRFSHTSSFGTINNGEWYNTSSLQMVSATGILFDAGIVFSNSTGTYNTTGPFPYSFTGTGHFYYGHGYSYSVFYRPDSDYFLRGEKIV